jgi:hypothetical protein
MHVNATKYLILFILFGICTSCSTTTARLWENTDPDEYILVSKDEVSEEKLMKNGAHFHKLKNAEGFLVQKSSWRRVGDYSLRVLVTPVTVVADTVSVVVVGATFGAFGMAISPDFWTEVANSSR